MGNKWFGVDFIYSSCGIYKKEARSIVTILNSGSGKPSKKIEQCPRPYMLTKGASIVF